MKNIKIIDPPIPEEAMRESAVFEPRPRNDDDMDLVTICGFGEGQGD